jgi:hypothetical protein
MKIVTNLYNGQYNEDDADISASRQQQKLRIVYEMLFEQQSKPLPAEYII